MKNLLRITLLLLCTNLIAQNNTNVEYGVFDFETEVIDFGDIAKNSNGERIFKFKNIGSSPIIIKEIKSSCGCTIVSKPETPILPSNHGEINVIYATNRVGSFSKSIIIYSDASESNKQLRIKGNVLKYDSQALTSNK